MDFYTKAVKDLGDASAEGSGFIQRLGENVPPACEGLMARGLRSRYVVLENELAQQNSDRQGG